ncbi:hypothetical protein [Tardiphaga sp. 839_C3_N1_4]|uniref:hypothetical protein n=1 Tax=Tardiphaga sp. 839_C3_N1_4 TaxID=3240761 RepID=UPI003F2084F5
MSAVVALCALAVSASLLTSSMYNACLDRRERQFSQAPHLKIEILQAGIGLVNLGPGTAEIKAFSYFLGDRFWSPRLRDAQHQTDNFNVISAVLLADRLSSIPAICGASNREHCNDVALESNWLATGSIIPPGHKITLFDATSVEKATTAFGHADKIIVGKWQSSLGMEWPEDKGFHLEYCSLSGENCVKMRNGLQTLPPAIAPCTKYWGLIST